VVKGAGKKNREEIEKTTLPGKRSGEIRQPEQKPAQQKPAQKISSENVFQRKTKPASQPMSKPAQKKANSGTKKIFEQELLLSDDLEVEAPVLDIEDSEAIRKAFIYSEIWNRKE
jgi:hypothetical protein